VDLDSDRTLLRPRVPADAARPLVHRKELIAERTGSTGEPGGCFSSTPGVRHRGEVRPEADGAHLPPSVGIIEMAGEGCFCPQAAFVKALVRRLVLDKEESLLLDLEAGLESFGRSVVEGLDLLLIVVEPGMRSLDTARRILGMASSLGVRAIRVVANKVRPENIETLRVRMRENGVPLDLTLSYREEFGRRDLDGAGVFDFADPRFEEDALRMLQSVGSIPSPS